MRKKKLQETKVCRYCGKMFTPEQYQNTTSPGMRHEIGCKIKQEILTKLGGKDELKILLKTHGSILGIHTYLKSINQDVPDKQLRNIYKEFGIDTSISAANKSKVTQERRSKTNLKKYGSPHNFCKNHPSRKEWEDRLFKEEGITNVFQRESVKKQCIETMLKKYGVEHAAQSPEFIVTKEYCIKKYGEELGVKEGNRICFERGKSQRYEGYVEKYGDDADEMGRKNLDSRKNTLEFENGRAVSSLNKKVKRFLEEQNIKFEVEFPLFNKNHYYFFDIKIGNTLIELNGDYGHATPRKYKSGDKIKFPNGTKTVDEIGEKDLRKKEFAESNGYTVMYIGEPEITSNILGETTKKQLIDYAIRENKINNPCI